MVFIYRAVGAATATVALKPSRFRWINHRHLRLWIPARELDWRFLWEGGPDVGKPIDWWNESRMTQKGFMERTVISLVSLDQRGFGRMENMPLRQSPAESSKADNLSLWFPHLIERYAKKVTRNSHHAGAQQFHSRPASRPISVFLTDDC